MGDQPRNGLGKILAKVSQQSRNGLGKPLLPGDSSPKALQRIPVAGWAPKWLQSGLQRFYTSDFRDHSETCHPGSRISHGQHEHFGHSESCHSFEAEQRPIRQNAPPTKPWTRTGHRLRSSTECSEPIEESGPFRTDECTPAVSVISRVCRKGGCDSSGDHLEGGGGGPVLHRAATFLLLGWR